MPQTTREGANLGVVALNGEDKVAPRHADTVFRAFKLRLQRQEVLVGFKVRVTLGHHHQPAQGASQLVLRFLELFEFFRVVQRARIDLDRSGLGPRLNHRCEGGLFLFGRPLDRLDQIGDQVGAALILVLHLRPCRLDLLIEGGNGVDPAPGQHTAQGQQRDNFPARGAYMLYTHACVAPKYRH